MKQFTKIIPLISCAIFLCYACEHKTSTIDEKSSTLFKKITPNESGIYFANNIDVDVNTMYNVLAHKYFYRGAGVAVGDINNDGLQDVFFTSNSGANTLYLNKGSLKFQNISSTSGIIKTGWSTGVVMTDINNDGYLDIYVCQAGPEKGLKRKNLLYLNNKDLTFTESAASFGLDDPGISRNASFFDYDKDGDLDCFVINESIYTRASEQFIKEKIKDKTNLLKCSSRLYKNNGNNTFIDVTEEAGVLNYGNGLTVAVSDINKDGWMDIYLTNDFTTPDFLYINQKNGTFEEQIKSYTKNISWASMGTDIADINNDGLQDIFTVEMASKDHFMNKTLMPSMNVELYNYLVHDKEYQIQNKFNSLQLNNGNNTFSNITGVSDLLSSEWSWSTLIADFDNDGHKDIFITNGFRKYYTDNDTQIELKKIKRQNNGRFPKELRQDFYNKIPEIRSKNLAFKNNGNLLFEDVSEEWGINDATYSNGIAYCDLDNDGDLDLLINNIDETAFLYENTSKNNFLKVKLNSSKQIIGTKLTLFYNNQKQFIEYTPNKGYLSSVDRELLFGLKNINSVDSLEVIWPNNKRTLIANIQVNKTLNVKPDKNDKIWNYNITKNQKTILREKKEIASLFKHKENVFNDFDLEVLLPYKQSTLGPLMSMADLNNDKLDDFYIGGSAGQEGKLFIQNKNGTFMSISGPWGSLHKKNEDLGSLFFDADNDGDLDLYVISGGNEFKEGNPLLTDRLYLNDGNLKFSYSKTFLPNMKHNGYKLMNIDIDNDGDQDLFIGGRLVQNKYPKIPESYILINDGKGTFNDASKKWLGKNQELGLINDIIVKDLNNDGKQDLIVTGEFMGIHAFLNNGNSLFNATETYFKNVPKGWWLSLTEADIDNDGDFDIIAGNLGLNSKYSASRKKPFEIVFDDFDNNGSNDLIITKEYNGKKVPLRGKECSSEQMPFISDKYPQYKDFANATLQDIIGKSNYENASKQYAESFESVLLINNNDTFTIQKLPVIAQSFPIHDVLATDIDFNGYIDLILVGNITNTEVETPKLDAGNGMLLKGMKDGTFKHIVNKQSGILIPGESRSILNMKTTNQKSLFIVSQNDKSIQGYVLND